jgi:hypothetical protein
VACRKAVAIAAAAASSSSSSSSSSSHKKVDKALGVHADATRSVSGLQAGK